jgi:hypothetical protein
MARIAPVAALILTADWTGTDKQRAHLCPVEGRESGYAWAQQVDPASVIRLVIHFFKHKGSEMAKFTFCREKFAHADGGNPEAIKMGIGADLGARLARPETEPSPQETALRG